MLWLLTILQALAARLGDRERGQTAVEYVGMVAVVAALTIALVALVRGGLANTIVTFLTNMISKIEGA